MTTVLVAKDSGDVIVPKDVERTYRKLHPDPDQFEAKMEEARGFYRQARDIRRQELAELRKPDPIGPQHVKPTPAQAVNIARHTENKKRWALIKRKKKRPIKWPSNRTPPEVTGSEVNKTVEPEQAAAGAAGLGGAALAAGALAAHRATPVRVPKKVLKKLNKMPNQSHRAGEKTMMGLYTPKTKLQGILHSPKTRRLPAANRAANWWSADTAHVRRIREGRKPLLIGRGSHETMRMMLEDAPKTRRTIHRGISADPKDFRPGKKVSVGASSWTSHKDVAESYTSRGSGKGKVVLHTLPGSRKKAVHLAPLTRYQNAEWVTPKSEYRVVARRTKGDTTHAYVRERGVKKSIGGPEFRYREKQRIWHPKPNRVVLSGSRNPSEKTLDQAWDDLHTMELRHPRRKIEVHHGGAAGVDELGEDYYTAGGSTKGQKAPVAHKANWAKEGRSAGPQRNKRMLKAAKPKYVLAYPEEGSKGTKDLIRQAKKGGHKVYVRTGPNPDPLPQPKKRLAERFGKSEEMLRAQAAKRVENAKWAKKHPEWVERHKEISAIPVEERRAARSRADRTKVAPAKMKQLDAISPPDTKKHGLRRLLPALRRKKLVEKSLDRKGIAEVRQRHDKKMAVRWEPYRTAQADRRAMNFMADPETVHQRHVQHQMEIGRLNRSEGETHLKEAKRKDREMTLDRNEHPEYQRKYKALKQKAVSSKKRYQQSGLPKYPHKYAPGLERDELTVRNKPAPPEEVENRRQMLREALEEGKRPMYTVGKDSNYEIAKWKGAGINYGHRRRRRLRRRY